MTVAELIKELQALPQDMKVQVLDSESMGPVDICQVSRGSWGGPLEDDEDIEDGFESMIDEEPEFIQDDETGKIAVLVTW